MLHQRDFTLTRQGDKLMLVAEISTLTMGGRRQIFRQVMPDAADEGFTLRTEKGNEVDFWAVDEIRDGEGELQATVFWPTPEALRQCPQAVGFEIHILND